MLFILHVKPTDLFSSKRDTYSSRTRFAFLGIETPKKGNPKKRSNPCIGDYVEEIMPIHSSRKTEIFPFETNFHPIVALTEYGFLFD